MAARITQLVVEVGYRDSNPKARITQLVIEIGYEINGRAAADSLNSWSDLVGTTVVADNPPLQGSGAGNLDLWGDTSSLQLVSLLTQPVSSDLNNLIDSLEVLLAVHLWAGGEGSWPIWHDSLSVLSAENIELSPTDSLYAWGDATNNYNSYTPSFFDTLSLSLS